MTIMTITMSSTDQQKGRVNWDLLDRNSDAETERHAREDGVDLDAPAQDWWPSPKVIRTRMNKTQEQISRALHIPAGTWRNWEQGRVVPDPASRALLRVAYFAPDVVLEALARTADDVVSA